MYDYDVSAVPPDVIEDCSFSVDEGKLYLSISGDFVKTIQKYLVEADAGGMTFSIDGHLADKLCESLYEMKHG